MHRKIRPVEVVAIICPHLLSFIGGEIILDGFLYGSMQIKILRWNIEGECQDTFIPPVMLYGANNLKQIIISLFFAKEFIADRLPQPEHLLYSSSHPKKPDRLRRFHPRYDELLRGK